MKQVIFWLLVFASSAFADDQLLQHALKNSTGAVQVPRFLKYSTATQLKLNAKTSLLRFNTFSTATQVKLNDKEPAITAGTAAQYLRGDKSLGTMNQAAVSGLTISSSPTFAGETITGAGDTTLTAVGTGARVDVNTPSARIVLKRDNTSGTVTANDEAGFLLVQMEDSANTLSNSHKITFSESTVTAGSVISDIIFYTINGAAIGTIVEAGRFQGANFFITGKMGIGTTAPKSALHVVGLPVYVNNAAAVTGGLTAGAFYRTGADPDLVCVVH